MKIFAIVVFVIFALNNVQGFTEAQVRGILQNIPQEDRISFLRAALTKGYEMEQSQKFSEISPQISAAIYDYLTANYLVTDKTKLTTLGNTICFPSGCIDLDDPGVHPFLT